MTDRPEQPGARSGDRLAKRIARAGLASRRDAETMITDLRVQVNGRTISNVAQTVTARDRVTVDGKPLPEPEAARLWLYHKPEGLVVTEKDEEGRGTVFDALRPALGRVLSVGRLDLSSEGLLLLTNDGDLKRRLELPATGWLRRYRVRVNGTPDEAGLDRLRAGIVVEGETGSETFAPMQVALDRQQGANAWLTVGLREGRNREVRRAMEALGLRVNRLIRVSYGPFQLGNLAPGDHEEVRPKVLRDQLGGLWEGGVAEARRDVPAAPDGAGKARGQNPRPAGDRLVGKGQGGARPAGAPRGRKPGDPDPRPRGAGSGKPPRTKKPPITRNDEPGPEGTRRDGKPFKPRGFGRTGEEATRKPGNEERAERRGPGTAPSKGGKPDRTRGEGRPGGKPGADAKAPRVTANGKPDRRGTAAEKKAERSERKARMRADPSVSLRKGGKRGIGKPGGPRKPRKD
jgi:23S rRNA pseudouridine2605 synthase